MSDGPRAQLAALPDDYCREILEVLLDNPSPTLIGIIEAMTMRRRAEQMTINNGTIEACPQCGAQAVCEHGTQDKRGRYVHLWDCPNCGKTQAIVCYPCSDCTG